MSTVKISILLCFIGAAYGVYILVKHLKLTKEDVATEIMCALPIIIGVLAWVSAIYTFYEKGMSAPIDMPRLFMLISWCMLASQYLRKYQRCDKSVDKLK